MRFVSLLVTSVLVAGCAAGPEIASLDQNIVRPDVGAISTREVGEPLFETIDAKTYDGLRFPLGTTIKMGIGSTVEPKGPYILTASGNYCGPADQVRDLAGPTNHALPNGMCFTEQMLVNMQVKFVHVQVYRNDPANFQQQLIYEGKAGKEIKISYREFHGDFARPGFTQELSFDLSEGDTIGAKGARIQIIKATNTEIQYKIIKTFSK